MKVEVQSRFRGIWTEYLGCPHYHGIQDSVAVCDANEMRPCIYEIYHADGCEVFREILKEWKEEIFLKGGGNG